MTVWDEFLAVMNTENELLRELIELSEAKQRQINNAPEISRISGEEQIRVNRLDEVDKERAQLFDVLSCGKRLEDWLLSLDEEQQNAVGPLILELAENLATLQSLNELNQELMTQSLSYVQFSLNLFMGDDTSPTYTRPGSTTTGKSIFDRKV